ncbi:MAG TPA: phage protease [Polyangiaceae bacterium]|nr:phage protease [Polyangiaceae bacterium]
MRTRSSPFALLAALDLVEGRAPDTILVFRWGENKTLNGTFLFDEEAARSVLKAFADYGNDLAFDGEHATFRKKPDGKVIESYGWAKQGGLFTDGVGLRARVTWTDDRVVYERDKDGNPTGRVLHVEPGGRTLIESGAVRFFSPTFDYDPKTRRVLELRPFALTIYPATANQQPLAASASPGADDAPTERPTMNPLALLMGLAATADEAAVANAVSSMRQACLALCHALGTDNEARALEAARSLVEDRRALLAAAGAQNAQEALGAVRAGQVARERVTALETENATIRAENENLKRAQLFAEHADRLTPALREEFKDKPVSFLSGVLPLLPKAPTSEDGAATPPGTQPPAGQTQTAMNSGAAGQPQPQGGNGAPPPKVIPLTADEKKLAASMGLTEQAFAERLAKERAARAGFALH